MGVGPRRKRIVGVPIDVYSVAVYADEQALLRTCSKHVGKSASSLNKDTDFLEDVKKSRVGKEIRMVITYKAISNETFWNALADRLAPMMNSSKAKKALPEFKRHFEGISFVKGTSVSLAMSQDGSLTTFVNNSKKGSVQSPELSSALLDIYLGSSPPSRAMQHDFLTTASHLLSKPS